MSDTPIIDAAFRAGCPWYTCDAPNCQPECANYRISALEILRAALPWDLPAERLEAMVAGLLEVIDYPEQDGPPTVLEMRQNILAAYRADPIFKELYPEKF